MKALVLLRKDIRTVLRNRRELFWMIMLPMILLGFNYYMQGRALQIQVALVGDDELKPYLREQARKLDGQIELTILNLSEAEASERLAQGNINGYLRLGPNSVEMFANLADTAGAVSEAVFQQMIRDLNQQLADQRLSELVTNPAEILTPVSWQVSAAGKQIRSEAQLIFSSLFVIMGIMTAMSLGQQSVSVEKDRNTLVSLRKSPLTDNQIVWAKMLAALFSSLLPLAVIIALIFLLMPEQFLYRPAFYLILISITFNSVSLGVLIGSYMRGANEGNSLRFMLTLPAMFLASMPVSLPTWVERVTSAVPTLVGAQTMRSFLMAGKLPNTAAVVYLLLTGFLAIRLAGQLLGREE